jgi:hypothetical protein
MSANDESKQMAPHYAASEGKGAEQHWDRMWKLYREAWFVGNITKYTERYRTKNGIKDLLKARHYLDKLIELEEADAERKIIEDRLQLSSNGPTISEHAVKESRLPDVVHWHIIGSSEGEVACGSPDGASGVAAKATCPACIEKMRIIFQGLSAKCTTCNAAVSLFESVQGNPLCAYCTVQSLPVNQFSIGEQS